MPVSKRWLYGLGGCAVVAIAVVNVGKQTKTHARIELLWDALHAFEEHAPAGAGLGWVSVNYLQKTGNLLEFGEGFHFARHLAERGRANLDFHFLDAQGNEETSPFGMETAVSPSRRPQWLITGTETPPPGVWNLVEKFERPLLGWPARLSMLSMGQWNGYAAGRALMAAWVGYSQRSLCHAGDYQRGRAALQRGGKPP